MWLKDVVSDSATASRGVKSLLVSATSQLIKLTVNTLCTLALIRILTPSDFGLFAMAAIAFNFLVMFKDVGLSTATVQQRTVSQHQMSTIFWLNQIAGISLLVLGVIAAPLLAGLFGSPEVLPGLLILSACFPVSALGAQHEALLRRMMCFGRVSMADVGSTIASFAIALPLALSGFGWWSLVFQRVAQVVLSTTFLWIVCRWRPSFYFRLSEVRSHAGLGMHVGFSNLFNYASRNADRVLIGWFWNPSVLGLYSKPYDLVVGTAMQVSTPLGQVAQSVFARVSHDRNRYSDAVLVVSLVANMAMLPFATLLISNSHDFVSAVMGNEWAESESVVKWLGLSIAFQLGGAVGMWTFVVENRGRAMSRLTAFTGLLNIAGFVAALPFGIAAVAATYSLLGVVLRIPTAMFVASRGTVKRAAFAQPFLATGSGLLASCSVSISLASCLLVSASPFERLTVSALVGCAVAVILITGNPVSRRLLLNAAYRLKGQQGPVT